MKDLELLRKEIDGYDREIVGYFEKRMNTVLKVLDYKRQHGLEVFHPERESQVLLKVVDNLVNDEFKEEIQDLFKEIMKISRRRQAQELFPYNLILIGFMGTGKTTVGKELSRLLEMPLVDMDTWIEKRMNMTIDEIFMTLGEGEFRRFETEIIREVSTQKSSIISCGGGVVLKNENVELLKSCGKVILLETDAQTIYQRIKDNSERPLLKDKMSEEYIQELFEKRKILYDQAMDITINTDGKDIYQVALEIIKQCLAKGDWA